VANNLQSYPNPSEILQDCALKTESGSKVSCTTILGAPLEIEFIENFGWSLEVRYDQLNINIHRQPFTGIQAKLKRSNLTLSSIDDIATVKSGEHTLSINTKNGEISCKFNGTVYWQSQGCPFSIHAKPVQILEDIQSIEHTTWDEPTPWRMTPTYFETHMARFQYPMPSGAILGLPGQSGELNRKGQRYDLFNTDQPLHIPSRPQMYQSWPIIMHKDLANAGWVGIFHDNPSRTFVDLGDFYKDVVLFESLTNNSRVYITHSNTLSGITSNFVQLLGNSVFPPAWAFGYQQCRYSYMSSEEIRSVAKKLRDNDIPCDAMYFDIDYMDGYRVFTKNRKTFGDLSGCINDLNADGFKSVCIIDPGVKIDPGYCNYEDLIKHDGIIKDKDGKPFEIICWPGKAVLPDFFSPRIRTLWSEMQDVWLKENKFDGLWNDMNEPSNFDGGREKTATAVSSQGSFRELFNIYGYSMAQASAEGWSLTNPNKRGVVITRSGYPGVQQHSVIWHGDNQAWWEHIRLAVDTALSYSLCGAFYTGPDVPGFFGNPSDDLAIRFFQAGSFLPLFRGHSYKLNSSKEPYIYSAEASKHIKAAIKLRYALLSEWYSNFERCLASGTPPMEPVFEETGSPVRDTFVLFNKFLVAPITQRDEKARAIWLPSGTWYRFGDTKNAIPGNQWITEKITLDKIPVFVRAGSIVALNTPGKNTTDTFKNALKFEIYRDQNGAASGYLFEDDGISSLDPKAKRWSLEINNGETEVRKKAL
jgi:alpha-glucosidase